MSAFLEFLVNGFKLVMELLKRSDKNFNKRRIIHLSERKLRQKDRLERAKQRRTQ